MAKTPKTTCEEAADELQAACPILAKRLRAEGRKIVRYERLILKAGDPENAVIDLGELEREAKRIQKARNKK